MKVNGRLGLVVGSSLGVKQGCPMRPGLFGFSIQVVADYLATKEGNEGPAMRADKVPRVWLACSAAVALGRRPQHLVHVP